MDSLQSDRWHARAQTREHVDLSSRRATRWETLPRLWQLLTRATGKTKKHEQQQLERLGAPRQPTTALAELPDEGAAGSLALLASGELSRRMQGSEAGRQNSACAGSPVESQFTRDLFVKLGPQLPATRVAAGP